MSRKTKRPTAQNPAKAKLASKQKIPLIDHLKELRRRVVYVAVCVAAGSIAAYALERKLIAVLLRPSHGQNFIYTSPLGGMNFLFGICLDIGLIIATPVIIYQVLAFLQPLMHGVTRKWLLLSSAATGFVALCGVTFGYFIGLPSALHFLLHQFVGVQIRPLITIQSYVSFVGLYLFGSALMFQLPLILLFINRIKPLKPGGLFKYERHLVVFAFVIAFIMNPTPNVLDQMLVVVPIIVMYQVGIGAIWLVNRRGGYSKLQQLRLADLERQRLRASRELRTLALAPPLPDQANLESIASDQSYSPTRSPGPALGLRARLVQ